MWQRLKFKIAVLIQKFLIKKASQYLTKQLEPFKLHRKLRSLPVKLQIAKFLALVPINQSLESIFIFKKYTKSTDSRVIFFRLV